MKETFDTTLIKELFSSTVILKCNKCHHEMQGFPSENGRMCAWCCKGRMKVLK